MGSLAVLLELGFSLKLGATCIALCVLMTVGVGRSHRMNLLHVLLQALP